MRIGMRVTLLVDMTTLGNRACKGDSGVIEGTGRFLTVRMDNGRVQFPRSSEVFSR